MTTPSETAASFTYCPAGRVCRTRARVSRSGIGALYVSNASSATRRDTSRTALPAVGCTDTCLSGCSRAIRAAGRCKRGSLAIPTTGFIGIGGLSAGWTRAAVPELAAQRPASAWVVSGCTSVGRTAARFGYQDDGMYGMFGDVPNIPYIERRGPWATCRNTRAGVEAAL